MNKLILLADDDSEIRKFIQQSLELNNFDVLYAVDGSEALRILRTISVDLVITDILMPKKGGIELANEIRKSFPTVKTIGITGADLETIVDEQSLDEIFHGFIQKPFNMDDLLNKVNEFIGK